MRRKKHRGMLLEMFGFHEASVGWKHTIAVCSRMFMYNVTFQHDVPPTEKRASPMPPCRHAPHMLAEWSISIASRKLKKSFIASLFLLRADPSQNLRAFWTVQWQLTHATRYLHSLVFFWQFWSSINSSICFGDTQMQHVNDIGILQLEHDVLSYEITLQWC